MRTVYLPISGTRMDIQGKASVLDELRRSKADQIVLVTNPHYLDQQSYEQENNALFDGVDFVRQNGYEPVVWIGGTIGHGGPLAHQVGEDAYKPPFTPYATTEGEEFFNTFCPLDKRFSDFVCSWIKDLIKGGVRTLLLDDDFRLSCRGSGFGCCCPLHMEEYQKRLGENVAREEMREKVFFGPPSHYRRIWQQLTGETLENFAKEIRHAADEVDPTVRIGLCVSPAGWDWDGTDALTLAKLLAGNTQPLLRLTAAPYWAKMTDYRLGEVISYVRLQTHWCRHEDVELLAEGDTYPRDRHRIPASYLEGFDMTLCADGQADGILKYMQLYVSSPRQERGYIDAHLHHAADYAFLNTHFASKKAVGIQVIEPMHTINDAILPEGFLPPWIPTSLKFVCENNLPHTFEAGDYPVLVFGEAARTVDLNCMKNGAILDMAAAELLMQRGVDVGIASASEASGAFLEYFVQDDDYIPQQGTVELKKLSLREGCQVDSYFDTADGRVPGAYRYQNADGVRFLVYPFDAQKSRSAFRLYRSYSSKRLLANGIEWLCGKKLPAFYAEQPDLYWLCKEDENSLSIGVWNFCEDEWVNPEIQLNGDYLLVESIGCSATVNDKRLCVQGTVPAFGFATFILRK